jgi:hypothetical protein
MIRFEARGRADTNGVVGVVMGYGLAGVLPSVAPGNAACLT